MGSWVTAKGETPLATKSRATPRKLWSGSKGVVCGMGTIFPACYSCNSPSLGRTEEAIEAVTITILVLRSQMLRKPGASF
jgi:hypothetical protein